MRNLAEYQTILWDFDGVIMDSMPIRDRGFEITLSDYPKEQVDDLMTYHRRNGGLSRYHKFRYFFEEIRKESITEEGVKALADRFSKVMLENLINPELLITDSVNFIRNNHANFTMHVVSGSDQTELRTICESLELTPYFKSIHGSPTPKMELVKQLLNENGYLAKDVCLIGDSINDFEAADLNGIDFFEYNNSGKANFSFKFIHSFKEYNLNEGI